MPQAAPTEDTTTHAEILASVSSCTPSANTDGYDYENSFYNFTAAGPARVVVLNSVYAYVVLLS
jgi:hypothetical protein